MIVLNKEVKTVSHLFYNRRKLRTETTTTAQKIKRNSTTESRVKIHPLQNCVVSHAATARIPTVRCDHFKGLARDFQEITRDIPNPDLPAE